MTIDFLTSPDRFNPFRPPDWRWQAANVYVDKPEDVWQHKSQDEYVLEGVRVLDDMAESATIAQRSYTLAAWGPLGQAVQLHMAASAGAHIGGLALAPTLFVAELEGYLMAGVSAERIAAVSGVEAATITSYERLFFDIRDRLPQSAWITSMVVGSILDGSPESLMRGLIRAYGYYRQSVTLVQSMVRAMDIAGGITESIYEAVVEDAKLALAMKANLVSRGVPADPKRFRSIMEMQYRQLEYNRALSDGTGDQKKLKTAIQNLLQVKASWGYSQPPEDGSIEGSTAIVEIDPVSS